MQYKTFALLAIPTLLIFTVIPNAVADKWKIYELDREGLLFEIPYTISDGELSEIEDDPDFTSLIVHVDNVGKNGEIGIAIPRAILDARFEGGTGDDDEFIVLVDGEETVYEEISTTSCARTLLIPISAGSEEIEVIATYALASSGIDRSFPATSPAFFIATDKPDYKQGEVITVYGRTCWIVSEEVIIEVLDPEGEIYSTASITPKNDGSFSTSLIVEGEHAINGTYTTTATYAGVSASSSFVVPEFPAFTMLILATAVSLILAIRLNRNITS